MPVKMEKDLKRMARKKGLTGNRASAYVYAAMNKIKTARKKKRKKENTMGYTME